MENGEMENGENGEEKMKFFVLVFAIKFMK